MIDRLLETSRARFTFVLGKGGVGKTTTAGAVAVALADQGLATHLISTDPAHSLSDLFRQSLSSGRAEPCECAPSLHLEEFDAASALRRWRERAEESVRALLERGTYLDAEDIQDFMEQALPGADEFMGALRLTELARGPAARVVVDTAPTGHALRLLDAGRILEGWLTALGALERKGQVVASRLARRPVRFPSEDLLDQMEAHALGLRELLQEAAFVLVSRPESMVREETRRLREELTARDLPVAVEVRIGGGAEDDTPGVLVVPPGDRPRGCEALRGWTRGWAAPTPASERRAGPAVVISRSAPLGVEALADLLWGGRERLLFVGKGGVGKTTCATACAVVLSARLRVILLSTDPAGSLSDLVGRPVTRAGVQVSEGLLVRQVEAEADFHEFRDRYRSNIEEFVERLGIRGDPALDRNVLESILELAPPGLDELVGMTALAEQGTEDVTIVDASPTGHFLRLVETPQLALSWIRALLRFLLKYRSVTGLGEPAERLLEFSRRIRALREALTDERRSGALPVVLHEPMVLAETRRLCEGLARAGIPVAGLIHNRVKPEEAAGKADPLVCTSGDVPVIAAPSRTEPITNLEEAGAFFYEWRRVA